MTLDQFVESMETRLFGLGRRLWPDDPLIQMREQAEELSEELQHRTAAVARCKDALHETRVRLKQREMRAAQLHTHIETFVHVGDQTHAWQYALELDQLRPAMQADRSEVERLERQRGHLESHVRQLERSLAGLQEKLYPNG